MPINRLDTAFLNLSKACFNSCKCVKIEPLIFIHACLNGSNIVRSIFLIFCAISSTFLTAKSDSFEELSASPSKLIPPTEPPAPSPPPEPPSEPPASVSALITLISSIPIISFLASDASFPNLSIALLAFAPPEAISAKPLAISLTAPPTPLTVFSTLLETEPTLLIPKPRASNTAFTISESATNFCIRALIAPIHLLATPSKPVPIFSLICLND